MEIQPPTRAGMYSKPRLGSLVIDWTWTPAIFGPFTPSEIGFSRIIQAWKPEYARSCDFV